MKIALRQMKNIEERKFVSTIIAEDKRKWSMENRIKEVIPLIQRLI